MHGVTVPFAVAARFRCDGGWSDRLLVAEGDAWRAPCEDELSALTRSDAPPDDASCCLLFNVPLHLRKAFWDMLGRQVSQADGDFATFAEELARFFTFKGLPPPAGAVYELIVQDPSGHVWASDVWAFVNLSDEPALLDWLELRLRLLPGEGCRTSAGPPADVVPPVEGELNALVAIRMPAEA